MVLKIFLLQIFSGFSEELVTRNSLELVTRNSLDRVTRISSELVTRNSWEKLSTFSPDFPVKDSWEFRRIFRKIVTWAGLTRVSSILHSFYNLTLLFENFIKLPTSLIQLKLLFSIYKNSIFYLCPNVIRFLENSFIRAENFRMWISGLRLNPLFFLISKLNIVRKTHASD